MDFVCNKHVVDFGGATLGRTNLPKLGSGMQIIYNMETDASALRRPGAAGVWQAGLAASRIYHDETGEKP